MANSLATRAARACAAATLVFSLGLAPSFARMGGAGGGPSARPAVGFGHPRSAAHAAAHGFNRFDGGRSGFHRFGPNRFDRFSFNNRFNRFAGNQLFIGGVGCCGWGGWGAVPISGRVLRTGRCRRRAGDHQHQRRSRSGRRRRRVRRLRDPHADLRQRRQICRRAAKHAVLTKRGRARPLRAGLLLR